MLLNIIQYLHFLLLLYTKYASTVQFENLIIVLFKQIIFCIRYLFLILSIAFFILVERYEILVQNMILIQITVSTYTYTRN